MESDSPLTFLHNAIQLHSQSKISREIFSFLSSGVTQSLASELSNLISCHSSIAAAFLEHYLKKNTKKKTILQISQLFKSSSLATSLVSLVFSTEDENQIIRKILTFVDSLEMSVETKLPNLSDFELNVASLLIDSESKETFLLTVASLRAFHLLIGFLPSHAEYIFNFYSESLYSLPFINFVIKHLPSKLMNICTEKLDLFSNYKTKIVNKFTCPRRSTQQA